MRGTASLQPHAKAPHTFICGPRIGQWHASHVQLPQGCGPMGWDAPQLLHAFGKNGMGAEKHHPWARPAPTTAMHYSPSPPHLPLLSPPPATVPPAAVASATASAVATPPLLLSSSPPLLLSSSPPPLSPSLLPLHAVAAAVAASPTAVVLLLLCNARKAAAWQRRHQTRWQPGQAGLGCMVWATMQMQGPNHCRGITAFMPAMQMHSAQAGHTYLSASCGEEGGEAA